MKIFRIGPLCFSIFVSIVLIIFFYRKYALLISYLDYPFIQSYQGMLTFIVLRMIALCFASVMLIFPLYGILLRLKEFIHRFRRGMLVARVVFVSILLAGFLLCGSYFSSKAKVLVEVKPFHARHFRINSERQVFIFGADGASWDIINRLIAQGELPNIKELMEQGSYAPLKTLWPCFSPRIWCSIDSGKIPEKHGILDICVYSLPGISTPLVQNRIMGINILGEFVNKAGVPLRLLSNSYSNRRAKPIWEILSDHGAKVGVVNWYYTWPIAKVSGFILSDRFPYFLIQEPNIKRKLTKEMLMMQGDPNLPLAYPLEEMQQYLREYLKTHKKVEESRIIKKMRKLSRYSNDKPLELFLDIDSLPFVYTLIKQYQPDFLALYLNDPDATQHFFWNYWQPEFFPPIAEEELNNNKDIIPNKYKKIDKALGTLREIAHEDAVFVLISDHGFGAYFNSPTPGGHSNSPDGIIIVSGKGIKRQADLKNPSIMDITPTILYLYNLPIARDMDGRVISELFGAAYLHDNPISYIDTYGAPKGEYKKIRGKVSKKHIEKLKALGYIH
jgi:predicted AlkP superfamily phosphohydrolase/phosphomutase